MAEAIARSHSWIGTRSWGMVLAAVWFILTGLMTIIAGFAIPGILMGLIALIAGVLILLGR
jgi:hypothetical protein